MKTESVLEIVISSIIMEMTLGKKEGIKKRKESYKSYAFTQIDNGKELHRWMVLQWTSCVLIFNLHYINLNISAYIEAIHSCLIPRRSCWWRRVRNKKVDLGTVAHTCNHGFSQWRQEHPGQLHRKEKQNGRKEERHFYLWLLCSHSVSFDFIEEHFQAGGQLSL